MTSGIEIVNRLKLIIEIRKVNEEKRLIAEREREEEERRRKKLLLEKEREEEEEERRRVCLKSRLTLNELKAKRTVRLFVKSSESEA